MNDLSKEEMLEIVKFAVDEFKELEHLRPVTATVQIEKRPVGRPRMTEEEKQQRKEQVRALQKEKTRKRREEKIAQGIKETRGRRSKVLYTFYQDDKQIHTENGITNAFNYMKTKFDFITKSKIENLAEVYECNNQERKNKHHSLYNGLQIQKSLIKSTKI